MSLYDLFQGLLKIFSSVSIPTVTNRDLWSQLLIKMKCGCLEDLMWYYSLNLFQFYSILINQFISVQVITVCDTLSIYKIQGWEGVHPIHQSYCLTGMAYGHKRKCNMNGKWDTNTKWVGTFLVKLINRYLK